MGDEIWGFVRGFILVPLAIGAVFYVGYFAFTGHWPNPVRGDCYTDWDGVRNSTVCD